MGYRLAVVGQAQVTWSDLLDAVERYVTSCPPGDLSALDAERLTNAGRDVLTRLQEIQARLYPGLGGHTP